MKIRDRHVLVTGGSHGIGIEIAAEFARRGALVTVLGRNAERLQEVARQIEGGYVQLDLADLSELHGALAHVEDSVGSVDILVNNAAIAVTSAAAEYADGDIERIMIVNTVAPIELTRQALPGMLDRGRGHIVNISSLAGVTAVPHLAVYGASKAALHHYTAGVQRELRIKKAAVGMTLATLGEVAGTHMMEDARKSPIIAAVSEKLARTRALPDIAPTDVAKAVADGVEKDALYVAVPRRLGPLIQWRDIPSRMQDIMFRGIG